MPTPANEQEYGPVALAERVLDVLFDQSPPPIAQSTALDIAAALLPYRQAQLRQQHQAEEDARRIKLIAASTPDR
jgi:hypothetical protein